jgi:branched-chain amino acid transport system substrate-binding protein
MVSSMNSRASAWLAFVAALGVLAAACGGSASSGGGNKAPYTFGYEGDQTDGAASTGVPLYNGLKTYVDTINAKGGVNGHKITIDARDDHSDPATGRINMQSFQTEQAVGVFGNNSSVVSGATSPLAAQQKILQLGIGAPDSFVIPAQPYIYNIQVGGMDMAYTMIDFVQNVLIKGGTVPSSPSVALLSNNTATSSNIIKVWQTEFPKLGWKIAASVTIDNSATDATSQDTQIANAKADLVMANILDNTANFVVKGLNTRGWDKPFVAYVGANSETTFSSLANPNYYAMRSYAYPKDPGIPGAVQMVKDANKLGYTQGLDSPYFSSGYVEGIILVQALQKCSDPCTSESYNSVMDKLGTIDPKGLAGTLSFGSARHRAIDSVRFFHWSAKDGHSVPAGDFIKSRAPQG